VRVVIIGTVQFTLNILQFICQQDVNLVGVVTGESNSKNTDYVDLSPFCDKNKIACYKTNNINSQESVEWIQSKEADVIFCLGWSRLIKLHLLSITPLGVIGYHPSLLPENRGRHPLIWALVLGLKETGSTFFFMDEGADTGDILSQEKIAISIEDDASSMYAKIVQKAKEQLVMVIASLKDGSYKRIQQNHDLANNWRKRGQYDGQIDWRMDALSIYNLIRGLGRPYAGAHFIVNGEEKKVWRSSVEHIKNMDNIEPGKVMNIAGNKLTIKCGADCITLYDVEPIPTLSVGDYL